MTRSPAELTAEIARLKRQMREWELEGRLDCEQEDLLLDEIADLQDDLEIALDTELARETPVSQKDAA